MSHFRASLPALLLLVFSTWCGTFDGTAHGVRTLVAHLLLVIVLATADGINPLRLSRRGQLLCGMLLCVGLASWWRSPVSRAGSVGLLLVPAFLMIPSFVERCWNDDAVRRRGLTGVTLVVFTVAAWALSDHWRFATRVTALPLGHHNLLAAWLVAMLPVTWLPWRDGGARRVLAVASFLLSLTALAATRSLSGLVALLVVLLVAVMTSSLSRPRRLGAVLILMAGTLVVVILVGSMAFGGLEGSRLSSIMAGEDLSTEARRGYLEAAWRGAAERPWFGWGPGSACWTLAEFLEPRPGVHPPDQVVADPHSLPFRLAYENGLAGLVLFFALLLAVLRARWKEEHCDRALHRAAFLGLVGWLVASLAGRPLTSPALPLVAMMLLGMLQAAGTVGKTKMSPSAPSRGAAALAVALATVLFMVLLPMDLAHLAYDQALTTTRSEERLNLLQRARRLDPEFPLYSIRLALLPSALLKSAGPSGSMDLLNSAQRGADQAHGIAHFHFLAGLPSDTAAPTPATLLRACKLNPLGALAPFHLALRFDSDPRAPTWAARALMADPLLLAAKAWHHDPGLRTAAVERLRFTAEVDADWLSALAESLDKVRDITRREVPGPTRRAVLEMDGEDASSLSLHAFRRRPWPTYLDDIHLLSKALPEIRVHSLSRSRGTPARLFQAPECGLPPIREP